MLYDNLSLSLTPWLGLSVQLEAEVQLESWKIELGLKEMQVSSALLASGLADKVV